MKPMTQYALKQLYLGKLMRLNYRQAGLVLRHKIYYLWDLGKPESKRAFEWYALPYDVMKSPNATQSMIYEALRIRDEPVRPPERMPKGKKPKKHRKIIPGIVEPYYPPSVQPIEEDWI